MAARASWTGPLIALIGAGLLLAYALVPRDEAASVSPDAQADGGFSFPVTVARVGRETVVERVELVGDVYSDRRAELAFERSGRVEEVLVDLGDEVAGGQVLARLDDAVLDKQIAVARADAEAARVQAEFSRREADRAENVGDDLIATSVRDERDTRAERDALAADRARAELQRLEAMLAQGTLRAPFDAAVVERRITDGSHASAGETAFVLIDLEQRTVGVEIPAAIALGLREGTPVTLHTDDLPGLEIAAQLDELVPSADPDSRVFAGLVDLTRRDPERALLPGVFVRCTFERRRVADALTVPGDAVLMGEPGRYVVVADPPPNSDAEAPLARFVPVTVLARGARRTAIRPDPPDAIGAGTPVLVTGADNVFPGAPLATVDHDGAAGGDEP